MPKPSPEQLDPARYPFSTEIAPYFRDLDINRHVNNSAMASLLEEARVRYNRWLGYHKLAAQLGIDTMVAAVTIDYLAQGGYPQPFEMHIGCIHIGRTSNRIAILVRQNGRAIVFSEAITVCTKDGQPVEMPSAYRAALAKVMMP